MAIRNYISINGGVHQAEGAGKLMRKMRLKQRPRQSIKQVGKARLISRKLHNFPMILRPTRAASKAGLPRSSSAKFTHSTHASSASAFAASNSHPVQQTLSLDGILMKKQKRVVLRPFDHI
jgi:hypothetical protein